MLSAAKHLAFSVTYEGEILRLRLRMTLRHRLLAGEGEGEGKIFTTPSPLSTSPSITSARKEVKAPEKRYLHANIRYENVRFRLSLEYEAQS
jgi:hypothetical protein